MQIEAVAKRQSQIIDGFLNSKARIIEQTGEITAGILEEIANKQMTLGGNNESQPIMIEEDNTKLMIESSEKEKSS